MDIVAVVRFLVIAFLCDLPSSSCADAAAIDTATGAGIATATATATAMATEAESGFDAAAITELLKAYSEHEQKADELLQSFGTLSGEAENFKPLLDHLNEEAKPLEKLIGDANAMQISVLAAKLDDVQGREQTRRRRDMLFTGGAGVTRDEMEEFFSSEDDILGTTEEEIREWIFGIIEDELANLDDIETNFADADPGEEVCVSPEQGAQEVQEALFRYSQDYIGVQDHALDGSVVYSMTSKTFDPQREDQLLGNAPWRRFIPDDWEDALPEGWENWDTGIPPYVAETLRWKGGDTALPETVLHPNTLAGWCWPMEGRMGNITIALPYPIQITSVTLDHATRMLLIDEESTMSAPRLIKVYGFPPCYNGCNGLSFDRDDPMFLAEIVYDIDGPTIQTFEIDTLQLLQEDEDDFDDDFEGEGSGSCSAVTETCGGGGGRIMGDELFSAVQFQVLDNWGNEDYTCLYRLRVHGSREE